MTISELANYLITRNMMHGERRAHELLEAADMVADLGLEPMATLGAAQRLTWSASLGANTRFEGRLPESYQSVIAALRASSAQ
ncbi:DUF1932 domain-containing protein [Alicyclobacillus sp. ALC3]|uniref:DUF1932 domain-containing protein n=1 Tax=Alicyclobacillus sp. ALC3 TaxID=2796143 RepID=UPI003FCDD6E3